MLEKLVVTRWLLINQNSCEKKSLLLSTPNFLLDKFSCFYFTLNLGVGIRHVADAEVMCHLYLGLTNSTTSIHYSFANNQFINSSSHAFPKYTIQIPNLPNTFLHWCTAIRSPHDWDPHHTTTWGSQL